MKIAGWLAMVAFMALQWLQIRRVVRVNPGVIVPFWSRAAVTPLHGGVLRVATSCLMIAGLFLLRGGDGSGHAWWFSLLVAGTLGLAVTVWPIRRHNQRIRAEMLATARTG